MNSRVWGSIATTAVWRQLVVSCGWLIVCSLFPPVHFSKHEMSPIFVSAGECFRLGFCCSTLHSIYMRNSFVLGVWSGLLGSLIVQININLPCIFWRSSKFVCWFPCLTRVEGPWGRGLGVTGETSTKGKKAGNGADRTAWTYVPSWRNGCQGRNQDGIHEWMQRTLDTPRFLPEDAKTRGKKQVPGKQRQIQRVICPGRI